MADGGAEPAAPPAIGLALSGGGSRAIAFHLGCLRALHDLGILPQVKVLSTVSGGALSAVFTRRPMRPSRNLRGGYARHSRAASSYRPSGLRF
jgi:Patatin-like phospholipase